MGLRSWIYPRELTTCAATLWIVRIPRELTTCAATLWIVRIPRELTTCAATYGGHVPATRWRSEISSEL